MSEYIEFKRKLSFEKYFRTKVVNHVEKIVLKFIKRKFKFKCGEFYKNKFYDHNEEFLTEIVKIRHSLINGEIGIDSINKPLNGEEVFEYKK